MPEKTILFSGPMVRAILERRKTQTRRMIGGWPNSGTSEWQLLGCHNGIAAFRSSGERIEIKVPYQAGDILWVREMFCPYTECVYTQDGMTTSNKVLYRADGTTLVNGAKWKPSIFMPRWAARIFLEVTDIRVQRLQEISEEDAMAEGVTEESVYCEKHSRAVCAYALLWDSLNLKRGHGWDNNDWVFVYTFRRVDHAK